MTDDSYAWTDNVECMLCGSNQVGHRIVVEGDEEFSEFKCFNSDCRHEWWSERSYP